MIIYSKEVNLMQIAIVEDREDDRRCLCTLLEQYWAAQGIIPELSLFSSGEEILSQFTAKQFQCVFLDICMGGIDGMETARALHRLDRTCKLIFCTTSPDYAVASYEVRAAYYLVKPVTLNQLADAMDAAFSESFQTNPRLSVHCKGHELLLDFSDICFVDCSDRKTCIHLPERLLYVDEPVNDVISRLIADERFLLCNRNTAVNMEHIALVEDYDFRLKNHNTVPIRQRGRAAVKKDFLAWTLRDLHRPAFRRKEDSE